MCAVNSRVTNVLIADDAPFMRKVLTAELEATGLIKVVGQAMNGKQAIEQVKTLQPDVVILDVQMPVMNGLDCLKELKTISDVPVFMFSALTREGTEETIQALELGAVDVLLKPEGGAHELSAIKEQLVAKIQMIVRRHKMSAGIPKAVSTEKQKESISRIQSRSFDLIVMGSSTGGVQAAREVVTQLPKSIPPIVWVQHMPPDFTKSLANRLDSLSRIHVKEAVDGEVLQRGTCYLAPGDCQMGIKPDKGGYSIKLGGTEKVSGHCPSCDYLFSNVHQNFKGEILGVILTGMGADGAEGLKQLHDAGAYVIGQDESSCVVYGMPRVAFQKGAVDIQVNIKEVAAAMCKVGNF